MGLQGKTTAGRTVAVLVILALGLVGAPPPARAAAQPQAELCGNGSAPDYGFNYDLLQEHWTVNWQRYVSQRSVTEVDAVLDRLNADSIAQTMILFLDADQVGLRVNCAVHFLRYMRLGLPAGERKDNGFAFLIVVETDSIDVHYGVGLGLPALTAPELTGINRAAEAAYESTGSMDEALLTLVREFDAVTRADYTPLAAPPAPAPTAVTVDVPQLPAGPLGVVILCGVLCLVALFIMFLLWLAYRLARLGIEIGPYGTDPFGGGGWMRGGGSFRGGSWGGGRGGSSSMRGGGGSGRSGRGN